MRNPTLCICKNKGIDQLSSNFEAEQHLWFRYTASTIPLLSKSKISSLLPASVTVQAGLCQTGSDTRKTGFLASWLILEPLRLMSKVASLLGIMLSIKLVFLGLNLTYPLYFQGVGEPPYLLSASVLCALKDAIQTARAQIGLQGHFRLDSPATVERIKAACGDQLRMRQK